MNQIDFREECFQHADTKDLMRFFSAVASDARLKNMGKIWAAGIEYEDDAKNPAMTTARVRFQYFKASDKGKSRHFVWTSYRAKSHACASSSISEL